MIPRAKAFLSPLLATAFVLAACHKQPTAEVRQESEDKAILPPEETARVEAQLVPVATAKADAPAQERLQGAVHPELTMRLQMYIERTGKIPENIYEFANTAVDSMPPAPPGMKYVIDPVDKAVKVTRK
jgi:hypothetical protein